MQTSPYARAVRLAQELRQLRSDAGLTAAQLAKKIRVSRVKITHIETLARRPGVGDVMDILEELGVTDARFDDLVRVARDAAWRGWWEERRYRGMGDRQALYANLEYGARRIREYAAVFIPGLLQTEAYIRFRNSLLREADRSGWNIEAAALGRLERQRVFSDVDGPRLDVLAEEVALMRRTAPPEIMVAQLRHLVEMCTGHERVSLRVIPIGVEMLQPLQPSTTFYLYDYPDPLDPKIVSLEALHKDVISAHADEVASYERLWRRLDEVALSQDESVHLIEDTITQLTK